MSTIFGKSYSDPRNINLKGGQLGLGLIRWSAQAPGGLWATNPFASPDGGYGLYINASGQLVFSSAGTPTILGAAGGGGGAVPSWNAIYAGSQTLVVSGTTFTINGTHATNNVLTLTDTGNGTGHIVQITNTGSGSDINGTSGTWGFSKAGAMTGKTIALAGTAGTTSLTLTLGNIITSAGGLSLTKAADNATLTVTNNTATTASVVVFADSAAHTGSTTTSWMTLTTGSTSGTILYVPAAGLTTGKVFDIVANAATDALVVNINSSAAALSSTGRLLNVGHTGSTTTSGVLVEFASNATDETVILKVTASGALATGTAIQVSGSSITTGNGLTLANLDALTDGYGIEIASAATAISSTGHLLFVNHTGTSGTSAVLSQFTSAATDETIVVGVTASGAITGKIFQVNGASSLTGTVIDVPDLAALTSGIGLSIVSSATAITGAGRLLFINHTGATTSTGTLVEVKTAATDATNATTLLKLTEGNSIVGVALSISSGTGLTTGSLIRATTSTAGALATNGAISFTATGNYTSNAAVDGGFVEVKANSTVAGTIVNVVGSALTTGIGLQLSNGTSAMTTGSLVRVTASGTGLIATNGIVSITHGGVFLSTSNAGVLDVRATAATGTTGNSTVVNFMSTAAAQTLTTILNVEASGFTTGYNGIMVRIKSPTTTGTGTVVSVIADGITSGGTAMSISTVALTTGTGLLLTNGTSAITTGSLLSVTASGVGTIATTGVVSFAHAGAYDSTSNAAFVNITANATLTGTVFAVNATALTTGIGFYMPSAEAGLTGIGRYVSIGGKFTIGKFGATVITGSAAGTAALTLTTGDILVSSGAIKSASPSASAGVGYATGAGGTATQTTNRSTAVSMSPNPCMSGTITTDTTSLAAGASAEFTVTNSAVAIGDVVVVSIRSGSSNASAGTAGTTSVSVTTVTAGTFIVSVCNNSTTTAETGAIIINFAVIKAVSA